MFDPTFFQKVECLSIDALSTVKDLEAILSEILSSSALIDCQNPHMIIAGGFPRDLYQSKPFNDVDIYIYNIPFDLFIKILKKTNHFEFIESKSTDNFCTTIFCEKTEEGPSKPLFRAQFIGWFKSARLTLDSFDLNHCKFFIPILPKTITFDCQFSLPLKHGCLYAFPEAISALKIQQIELSSLTKEVLTSISKSRWYSDDHLYEFEKIIRRIRRFKKRGMKLSQATEDFLIESFEEYFTTFSVEISSRRLHSPNFKSPLLEDIISDYYMIRQRSVFTLDFIVKNMIKEWIHLLPPKFKLSLLLSEASLIRTVAEEMIKKDNEETSKDNIKNVLPTI